MNRILRTAMKTKITSENFPVDVESIKKELHDWFTLKGYFPVCPITVDVIDLKGHPTLLGDKLYRARCHVIFVGKKKALDPAYCQKILGGLDLAKSRSSYKWGEKLEGEHK